ncbi:hypothetical protein AB4Y87_23410 [Paenarthrobacter sp. RAF54_2]|uniref:hypothetical protein n=1 Tax=Paenarthrobacter sp. RAF54_2 TaxID=3233061 RepID=UPI003F94A45A
MDGGDWVAAGAAVVAVIALVFTALQARSAKIQAQAARDQVEIGKRQAEMQEQLNRDQQQPYVWVDYRVDPVSYWLVDLVIKNEGPTTARNVRITFDPMVGRAKNLSDMDLAGLPGFVDGFSAIPPGREMRWSLGSHTDLYDQRVLTRHKVRISFDGPFGPVEPYAYTLAYDDMKFAALRDPGHIGQVAKELKEIKRYVEKGVQAVRDLSPDEE